MSVQGWRYYNHAMIPEGQPNTEPDLKPIESGEIWADVHGGTPLLARWINDWDCGYETNWWYVIKDEPFDLSRLKAKRRYEINKGIKSFDVKRIQPKDYMEEIYSVQVAAFADYPEKYRPKVGHDAFLKSLAGWDEGIVYGAFCRESGELAGYALLYPNGDFWLEFSVLKTKPSFEKQGVNAAIVAKILESNRHFLEECGVICDGARSINHETHFQDYLEKYFGFRRAYCKLRILYNPKIAWLIKILYPLRKMLLKFDWSGMLHQVNAVLKMEAIVRSQ